MIFENHYTLEEKKENGVYYTPNDIALFMAHRAKNFDDGFGIWLDPCCGLGVLSIYLASIQDDPIEFVKNRLIINEKDKNQLKIALSNFREKFGVEPKSFNKDFLKGKFGADYIIMNPPYFKYGKSDIYAYFLEKACKTTKGFVSINPISFTNGENFHDTRVDILKFSSINFYHFDNIPGHIFDDAKVRVSIVVAHNKGNKHKTTGVIRWKSEFRQQMLNDLHNELTDGVFSKDIFYKTSPNTKQFIHQGKSLNDFVVPNSEFTIYVTNSPRYFITASSAQLDRKGQIKICLQDLDSYRKSLIMLNSSYLYWWWRISDSSLSLTKKTLLTLPWVDFQYDEEVIDEILVSEQNNKVYKKNAKKIQENIKHPRVLIERLNSFFLPDNFITLHD
jgi:predicted RNA methylase